MSAVHLLMKHPPYPYNPRLHLKAGEVMGAFSDKTAAQSIADEKNSRKPHYLWTVQTKRIKP